MIISDEALFWRDTVAPLSLAALLIAWVGWCAWREWREARGK